MTSSYSIEKIYIPLYFVCTVGFIANFLLLVALIRDPLKCFRNSSTYLIASLCVSDMTLPFFFTIVVHTQHTGLDFFIYTFLYSSILTIFSIAVDRYMVTVHPFKHRIWMNGKKSALWICSNWVLCTIHPTQRAIFGYKSYDMRISSSIGFILMAISCILYAKTYRTLRKNAQMMNDNLPGRPEFVKKAERMSGTKSAFKIRQAREQKFLTTIVIIACIAFVTFLPSVVQRQVYSGSHVVIENQRGRLIQSILIAIMSVNFAANPFIYYLRLEKYRKTFKILYGCK